MSDLALVLRRFDYGETSQTARLFSREHGRVGVLAKGVKRPNASLRGPLDLFALAEIDLERVAAVRKAIPVGSHRQL